MSSSGGDELLLMWLALDERAEYDGPRGEVDPGGQGFRTNNERHEFSKK
ncbi:hypothetical protein IID22_04210 [Patescibacteria group bacterium]|nr:hypothetical protein [Patescibacteria group bacterium]